MNFKEDPKNLIIPLDLAKIIYNPGWDAELAILDQPDQVYGKALHGSGKVDFKNGNKYEGDFHNGMLHGINLLQNIIKQGKGKFTWASGVVYDGDFTYNKIEGEGKYFWPDGSTYIGQVVNGLRQGKGMFISADDNATYDGLWDQGYRNGLGKITFKSGAVFVGQFVNGNKQGKGKMSYPSGNYYDGEFYMDKKAGQGVMFWLNSNEKYFGEWKDNQQNGWGTHIWIEPKGEGSKQLRNRYEGEWENGERSGVGVFYYANGAKYIGQWKNNLKCGVAMFLTDTGGVIIGEFKQDRLIKVYSTTENESRTGILPREIAPTSAHEQAQVSEQMRSQGQKTEKEKKGSQIIKKTVPDKLAGINNPTQTNIVKNIEVNPYSYMIDFSDLYRGLNVDVSSIENAVQTMLLRHNSDLKNWYKFFAQKFEQGLSEETFSLSLDGFWKIARDAKLLNPQYSLAVLNRCFLQGSKNNYPLHYGQKDLNQYVEVLANVGHSINLQELDDIFHIDLAFQCNKNDKITQIDSKQRYGTFYKPVESIHYSKRCVLFRHFIELLVRLSYLKYGSLLDLHRAIERVIVQKLTPYYERKKGKANQSLDDTKRSNHAKIILEDYLHETQIIYDQWSVANKQGQFGYEDKTINLEQIFKLLDASEQDKNYLISLVEKQFDTDEGSIQQSQSVTDQSSINQTQKEDGRQRKKKQQEQDRDAKVKQDQKHQILKYELLLFEFTDILLAYLIKKHKDLNTHNPDELRIKAINHIKKYQRRKPVIVERVKQTRYEPQTSKDVQKEQLKQLRIQQELKAKLKKQLEEERKQEERERNLMGLEDQNVLSEYEEEEQESEESDY